MGYDKIITEWPHLVRALYKNNNKKHRIIEGPRGSGKTTLAKKIVQETNRKYHKMPDPNTKRGQKILEYIKKPDHNRDNLACMFALDAEQFHNKARQGPYTRVIDRHAITTGYALQAIRSAKSEDQYYLYNVQNLREIKNNGYVVIIDALANEDIKKAGKDHIDHPTNKTYVNRVASICKTKHIPYIIYQPTKKL